MPEISNDIIRYKILEILYKIALRGGSKWEVERSYLIHKLNIAENIIDFNVWYLHDRKLAKVVDFNSDEWATLLILAEGIDVYEHKSDFSSQYPFIKIAIQNIDGSVYGNAVQAIDSQINLNQKITDSFKQAYSIVELESNLSDEQKTEIKDNLEKLEEEIKAKKPDRRKVRRLWSWIKDNAKWIIPTLKDIIEEILKP